MKKWKLLDTKLLCRSEFVSVFEDTVVLPSGKEIIYSIIELQDFVSVLPLIKDKVVMIEILRYPRNCLSLEIPSTSMGLTCICGNASTWRLHPGG